MKLFLISFFLLSSLLFQISCQTIQLQSGVEATGQIPPNEFVQFNYPISTTENGIMVEVASTAVDSRNATLIYGGNVLRHLFGIDFLETFSSDLTTAHSTGFLCPDVVNSGSSNLTISTQSSSTETYVIKVTEYESSLNNGNIIIDEELCCIGIEGQIVRAEELVGKMYSYTIDPSATQINIVVRRNSTRNFEQNSNTARLLVRYNTCAAREGPIGLEFDYEFNIPDSGDTTFSIDALSNPPLQTDSVMFLTFQRISSGLPDDGSDTFSVGVCEGDGCSVTFPDVESSDASKSEDSKLHFFLLCSFLYFSFFFTLHLHFL